MTAKVINLIAGPGAGKSTTAAGIFHIMKCQGHSVELVTEFAKDLTWEGHKGLLKNQLYLTAEQYRRMWRVAEAGVEWIITDSPLLLGPCYAPPDYFPSYEQLTWELFDSFENFIFYLRRVKPYWNKGREGGFNFAKNMDDKTLRYLTEEGVEFTSLDGDVNAPAEILKLLGLSPDPNVKVPNE